MAETVFRLRVLVEPELAPTLPPAAAPYTVLKSNEEKRYLLLVAYPCMKADVAVAADGHIDFANAETVERAAHRFMAKGAKIGLYHQPGTEGAATCVESYVWPSDTDWVTKAADGTMRTVSKGDWLIGVICPEDVWQVYKSGLLGGASPQGGGRRRVPTAESLAQLRS